MSTHLDRVLHNPLKDVARGQSAATSPAVAAAAAAATRQAAADVAAAAADVLQAATAGLQAASCLCDTSRDVCCADNAQPLPLALQQQHNSCVKSAPPAILGQSGLTAYRNNPVAAVYASKAPTAFQQSAPKWGVLERLMPRTPIARAREKGIRNVNAQLSLEKQPNAATQQALPRKQSLSPACAAARPPA